jgi:hypothetical protein
MNRYHFSKCEERVEMIKKLFKCVSTAAFTTIFILNGNPSVIADENTYYLSSKSLLTYCQSNLPLENGICQGYLVGIVDSIYSGHQSEFVSICIPKGINSSDLKSLFITYATEYPEFFERPADGLFTDALAFKYSC